MPLASLQDLESSELACSPCCASANPAWAHCRRRRRSGGRRASGRRGGSGSWRRSAQSWQRRWGVPYIAFSHFSAPPFVLYSVAMPCLTSIGSPSVASSLPARPQELVLLEKEKELLEKDQTVMVLREEVRWGAAMGEQWGPHMSIRRVAVLGTCGSVGACPVSFSCHRFLVCALGRWLSAGPASRFWPSSSAAAGDREEAAGAADQGEGEGRGGWRCRAAHSVTARYTTPWGLTTAFLSIPCKSIGFASADWCAQEEASLAMGLCTGGSMLP